MSLLTRTGADGRCLGGIRLSGVLRPKQVVSVGAQTRNRAAASRLGSRRFPSVSHACAASGYRPPAVPYHTPVRVRLSTPNNDPVTRNAQYITNTTVSFDCIVSARPSPAHDHIRHGVLRGFAFSPITASARSSSRSTRRSARCSSANSWRGSASAFRFCTADSARRRARRRSASSMLAHTRSGRPSFSRSRRRSFRFGMSKKRYPVRIPQFAAGIRVQESRTGSSGRSWRAKRWTEILEGMGLGGRLGRGKER